MTKLSRVYLVCHLFTFSCLLTHGQEKIFRIKSDFETDSTTIRIVNTSITDTQKLKLIFVLPVVSADAIEDYGDGLRACHELIDENKIASNVVFISPEYKTTPWYGNHAQEPFTGQMNYTIDVVKFIKNIYSCDTCDTYLLGFSKSGYGSVNLLHAYPELFEGILIWDVPLSTDWNTHWGMVESFGTRKNFYQNYYLLRSGIDYSNFRNKHIIIGGYDLFKDYSTRFLKFLDQSGVNYVHLDTLNFQHKWNNAWIYPLLQRIPALTQPSDSFKKLEPHYFPTDK